MFFKPQIQNHNLEDILCFLDDLRNSGIINMYAAVQYIIEEFDNITQKEAQQALIYWMSTFLKRKNDETR